MVLIIRSTSQFSLNPYSASPSQAQPSKHISHFDCYVCVNLEELSVGLSRARIWAFVGEGIWAFVGGTSGFRGEGFGFLWGGFWAFVEMGGGFRAFVGRDSGSRGEAFEGRIGEDFGISQR